MLSAGVGRRLAPELCGKVPHSQRFNIIIIYILARSPKSLQRCTADA